MFKTFLKNNIWYLVGPGIIFFVIIQNLFPSGFIIAGEDTFQLIDAKNNFQGLFYDWQGRASIFYSLFYFLDKIGISDTGQLSWYLGIFIIGAYLSFDLFVRLIFKKTSDFNRFLISLFYALNLYTLYIFTYSWGYSYYQSLYIFIPLLFGLYLGFIKDGKLIFGALFLLVLFLGSSGFGNPALALSLAIVLFFLTCFLLIFGYIKISKDLVLKLLILFALSLLVNFYWILPLLTQVRSGVGTLTTSNILDLAWWLQHSSNPLTSTIRLIQGNGDQFFPGNFPYLRFEFLKEYFILLSFLPFLLVIFSIAQKKIKKGLYWSFLSVFILLVMGTARVRFPFEKINNFLFQLPGLNTLRGYEKFAIFIPFVMAVLLLFFLIQSRKKVYYKFSVAIFCIVLLLPLPFYAGKIQQNMSFIFAREKVKDYRTAEYSFLVKIPEEYYEIQSVINNDPEEFKIASLPYNVIGSIGWANYPEWKLQGEDVTKLLYNKIAIDPNNFYFNQWLFAREFNQSNYDPVWIVELLGILNTKYIIFHKDVAEEFTNATEEKIEYLEKSQAIKKIEENDYFNLYQISDQFRVPYVFGSEENLAIQESPEKINNTFSDLKEDIKKVNFNRVNPKKISVSLGDNFSRNYLILNEPYDSDWKAFYKKNGEKKKKLVHVNSLGYANGWKIESNMKNGEVVIEYLPMKLFYYGAVLSILTVIAIIGFIVIYLFREFKLKKKNGLERPDEKQ
jgi:hypothetical protein